MLWWKFGSKKKASRTSPRRAKDYSSVKLQPKIRLKSAHRQLSWWKTQVKIKATGAQNPNPVLKVTNLGKAKENSSRT
jgi:hypothetical protein